ncbi:MAG: hypothetical protein NTY09_07935 [bacterium]|nr:hypothetical protein [bacterium]
MSGTSSPIRGKKSQHFQAARNWLDRAESQIESGMDIMAASTLMLAQAELKLAVESIASGPAIEETEYKPKILRFPKVSRNILGGIAIAACLVLGIAIGRITLPGNGIIQNQNPMQIAQTGITENITPGQIPSGDQLITEPAPDESVLPIADNGPEALAGATLTETGEEISENPVVTSTPQPNVPVYAPPSRPHRTHVTNNPVNTNLQPVETPSETVSEPPSIPDSPDIAEILPGESEAIHEQISSAEVALRTILALSDRLREEKN